MSTLADIQIDEKIRQITQEPAKYKVIFINDDVTPIEWVIEVLVNTFKHSQSSAEALTLQIHSEGSAVVGVYSYEIAEQKSVETTVASRDKGFPLQIRLEKE